MTPSRWEWPAQVALAGLAGLAVWIASARWGAAVSPDSTVYLSAAENLAKGRGLVTFDGQPLVSWAPLYAVMLAAFSKLGLGALGPARVLGALGMAAIVLLAAVWLRRHVLSPAIRIVAVAAVCASTGLLRDALFVWSEILFVLFVILCLLDLERSIFLRAAAWAALASLTRYVGVTAGLVVLVVAWRGPRRRDVWLCALVAFGPLALWLVRNVLVSGVAVYAALPPPARSAWQVAVDGFQVFAQEWLPYAVPHGLRAGLVLAALAGLVTMLVRSRPSFRASLVPTTLWLALYAAALFAGALGVAVEPVSQRLVSPMLVPLLVLVARAVDAALAEQRHAWRVAALALSLSWLVYSASRATTHLEGYFTTGAESYTAPEWRRSALAAALRQSAESDTVFGNAPDAVYFLAGQPAQFSPRRTYYASDRPVAEDLPRFARALERAPARLAWFHEPHRDFLYSPSELGEHFEVTPEGRYADGEIYGIKRK